MDVNIGTALVKTYLLVLIFSIVRWPQTVAPKSKILPMTLDTST